MPAFLPFVLIGVLLMPAMAEAQTAYISAKAFSRSDTTNSGSVRIASDNLATQAASYYGQVLQTEGRVVSYRIPFEPGTAVLSVDAKPGLTAIVHTLQAYHDLRLRIEAHTRQEGDAATNLDLAQQRAVIIRTALIQAGVAEERLIAQGKGEGQPVETARTYDLDGLNQRIEFVKN